MAGRTGTARITAGSLDLASTVRGWEVHLRAGGRSPATLDKYLRSARQLIAFLEARGVPATTAGLAREHVQAWIAELLETRAPATAMSRYQGLRQWFACKGRRPRSVPFGDRTGQAVERWLRARATLPGVSRESGPLWMGKRGVMSPSGIRQMVWRRSEAAGIGRVFPHQLRHTFAHTWLAAGESEGDLMRWPAGAPERCSPATAPRRPTNGPVTPTAGRRWGTASEGPVPFRSSAQNGAQNRFGMRCQPARRRARDDWKASRVK